MASNGIQFALVMLYLVFCQWTLLDSQLSILLTAIQVFCIATTGTLCEGAVAGISLRKGRGHIGVVWGAMHIGDACAMKGWQLV